MTLFKRYRITDLLPHIHLTTSSHPRYNSVLYKCQYDESLVFFFRRRILKVSLVLDSMFTTEHPASFIVVGAPLPPQPSAIYSIAPFKPETFVDNRDYILYSVKCFYGYPSTAFTNIAIMLNYIFSNNFHGLLETLTGKYFLVVFTWSELIEFFFDYFGIAYVDKSENTVCKYVNKVCSAIDPLLLVTRVQSLTPYHNKKLLNGSNQ